MQRISFFLFVLVTYFFVSFNCMASSGGIPTSVQKKERSAPVQRTSTAGEKKKTKKVSQTKAEKQRQEALRKKRALISKKKKEVDNIEWDVDMRLSGSDKTNPDTIIFYNGKVSSKKLVKEGFLPTNYTLTLEDNGKIVWETMQSANNETIFFRGEIAPGMDKMKGIISQQRLEGTKDFSFVSTDKRIAGQEKVVSETIKEVSQEVPQEAPVVE